MGTRKNRLDEAVLTSTNNLCFDHEFEKYQSFFNLKILSFFRWNFLYIWVDMFSSVTSHADCLLKFAKNIKACFLGKIRQKYHQFVVYWICAKCVKVKSASAYDNTFQNSSQLGENIWWLSVFFTAFQHLSLPVSCPDVKFGPSSFLLEEIIITIKKSFREEVNQFDRVVTLKTYSRFFFRSLVGNDCYSQ